MQKLAGNSSGWVARPAMSDVSTEIFSAFPVTLPFPKSSCRISALQISVDGDMMCGTKEN
jgi:hypothetical protein